LFNIWFFLSLTLIFLFILLSSKLILRARRAEEALKLIRERLEAVTESVGVGLAIISKDYTTLWANKVLKDMAGEVEGVRCHYTFFQNSEICKECKLKSIILNEMERAEFEVEGKDSKGKDIWSQVIMTPIRDSKNKITSVREILIPITERKIAEQEREKLIKELEQALDEVKTLSGMLPICANCKKIRDDQGYWNRIEGYISERTDAKFTHGICPDCKKELYPELYNNK